MFAFLLNTEPLWQPITAWQTNASPDNQYQTGRALPGRETAGFMPCCLVNVEWQHGIGLCLGFSCGCVLNRVKWCPTDVVGIVQWQNARLWLWMSWVRPPLPTPISFFESV